MNEEPTTMPTPSPEPKTGRIPLGTIFSRAIRLRCPRCGKGPLFKGYFTMDERCSSCQLKYDRGPGYFLGSTYINYAATTVLMTIGFVLLSFGAGIDKVSLIAPIGLFIVIFPMVFFRFARSFWLGIDCFLDSASFRRGSDDEIEIENANPDQSQQE
jgi:uncharacterized protein (DUF983 family)